MPHTFVIFFLEKYFLINYALYLQRKVIERCLRKSILEIALFKSWVIIFLKFVLEIFSFAGKIDFSSDISLEDTASKLQNLISIVKFAQVI